MLKCREGQRRGQRRERQPEKLGIAIVCKSAASGRRFFFQPARIGQLQAAGEQQDDNDNQDDTDYPNTAVPIPIAVSTEAAAEAAYEHDDQDDEENEPKRHDAVLPRTPVPARLLSSFLIADATIRS
jgi:hypothetical protein